MVCTFFGHRHTPDCVREVLVNTIIELIENRGVNVFYVGNHGGYDHMVRSVLKELKNKYPHICYSVVLAYMPGEKYELNIVIFLIQCIRKGWKQSLKDLQYQNAMNGWSRIQIL